MVLRECNLLQLSPPFLPPQHPSPTGRCFYWLVWLKRNRTYCKVRTGRFNGRGRRAQLTFITVVRHVLVAAGANDADFVLVLDKKSGTNILRRIEAPHRFRSTQVCTSPQRNILIFIWVTLMTSNTQLVIYLVFFKVSTITIFTFARFIFTNINFVLI